jgi:4-amino-4-deoxy-L-arabinose transferase-like glycosyltransferase
MKIFKLLISFIESTSSLALIAFILFLQIAVHVRYLNLPPIGFHQWRQTQTLSVARNFSEESMNFFLPRVDNRGAETGITGLEFPIVNYTIALGYRLFGFSHLLGRLVIMLYSCLALMACFFFIRTMFRSQVLAFFGTFFLIFSPLFCYYSINVLPDIPSLAFIFLTLYAILKYEDSNQLQYFCLLCIALIIAALIKISAFVLLPFLLLKLTRNRYSRSQITLHLEGIALVVVIVGVWYFYARYLSNTYHNFDFRLNSNFPYDPYVAFSVLKKVFIQWLPELYINYAQFILFCVGIYYLRRINNKTVQYFLLFYTLGYLAYMAVFLPMFQIHDYYAIPAIPLLIVLVTSGFQWMLEQSETRLWAGRLTILLLMLVPVLGSVRALSRFEGAEKPWDLFTIENHLNMVLPNKQILIIAAGDDSPSIYLYFMHRKGWAVGDKISEDQLLEMLQKGAAYLISSSRSLESTAEIKKHLSFVSTYGTFRIFALPETTHKQ